MSWANAEAEDFLFTNGRMNMVYATACLCYESRSSERSDESLTGCEGISGHRLRRKRADQKNSMGGWGVIFVSMKTRRMIYFALAILGFVFGIAAIGCEEFSGNVIKPGQVRAYDYVIGVILFELIMWQAQRPVCSCVGIIMPPIYALDIVRNPHVSCP